MLIKKSVFLLVCISVFSCNQFESFTQFVIRYEQDAKIESSTGINLPFNLNTPRMETNAEQKFESNNTHKDKVESIQLDSLRLVLNDPPGEDFSFLEEITIYLNAEGLDEIEIAKKVPVPTSASNTLVLDCTELDLQEYIKKDEFSLRLRTVTDELITKDHYFTIYSVYSVDAKLN